MWAFKSGEPYDGPVHELAGRYWSGLTRTSESREVIATVVPQHPLRLRVDGRPMRKTGRKTKR
jgi:hypothetical protein